jgi:ATPase subunit of ABC transporter with duplicated ATPase domains
MDSISEECAVDQAATGSAPSEPVISVRGLVKRYGSHEAVAGIDLQVRRGEIFACLGPNGAGKTTMVEILEGFGQRTAGQVSVLGHDPATAGGAWRDRVGVVLQETEPEPGLTVRECLALYAGFYRTPRDIDETIALAGLTEKAGALATRLSAGGAGLISPSPSSATQSSSSWTSRPPASTRPPAAPPGRSLPGSGTWARPSSSPPITWTRRNTWPTGSRCCRPGASLPRARRRRWAGVPHGHRHQLHSPRPRARA